MAEKFEPGDRVRGFWDLATVLEVLDGGRVRVQFDEVDATGTRVAAHLREPVVRLAHTLTKVPRDTPMADEQFATGGYVSGPKPGAPPLVPDGCTLFWPLKPAPAPPGLTVQIDLNPPSARGFLERLRRWVR